METTDSYFDGRYTFTFWSAILDKNNREKTWSSSGDENVVRILSFAYANLLDKITEEANVHRPWKKNTPTLAMRKFLRPPER